jgi:hypothetical protein
MHLLGSCEFVAVGIAIERQCREAGTGRRTYRIYRAPSQSSQNVTATDTQDAEPVDASRTVVHQPKKHNRTPILLQARESRSPVSENPTDRELRET